MISHDHAHTYRLAEESLAQIGIEDKAAGEETSAVVEQDSMRGHLQREHNDMENTRFQRLFTFNRIP